VPADPERHSADGDAQPGGTGQRPGVRIFVFGFALEDHRRNRFAHPTCGDLLNLFTTEAQRGIAATKYIHHRGTEITEKLAKKNEQNQKYKLSSPQNACQNSKNLQQSNTEGTEEKIKYMAKEKQEISCGSSDKVFFMTRFLQDFIFSVPSVSLW
jgi:hypothetical protein